MSKSEYYVSASGEDIEQEDYTRWLEQASEAFHVLDANFNGGKGAIHPDDVQDQLADLLCELRHYAQAKRLDFEAAIGSSESNYNAEKRKTVPKWARTI